MKQLILLIIISLMVTSCNSQTDLETLKFNEQIPETIKKINGIEEDTDPIYGLKSFTTDELQNFKFGDSFFTKYSVPKGYAYSKNYIHIHVDNFDENKYLGFSLNIANDEQGIALLKYLKKKFGKPEERDTEGNGIALFWQVEQPKQWIFLKQYKEITRDDKTYLNTTVTIVKQGVRVENTTDPKLFTILQSFSLSNPKKSTPEKK
jgi:hypothetical protein